jgi:micrococcal nuclease
MITRRRAVRILVPLIVAVVLALLGLNPDALGLKAETAAPPPISAQGTVARVIDGDTIELAGGEKVRLIGIDAPELSPAEPYGEEAKQHLQQLIGEQPIRLEKDVSERDKYGRLLRYVFVGEANTSIQMVRDGYARSSTYPPDVKHQELIRSAEREAREAGRGLWR